jgi:hypothetical protein
MSHVIQQHSFIITVTGYIVEFKRFNDACIHCLQIHIRPISSFFYSEKLITETQEHLSQVCLLSNKIKSLT